MSNHNSNVHSAAGADVQRFGIAAHNTCGLAGATLIEQHGVHDRGPASNHPDYPSCNPPSIHPVKILMAKGFSRPHISTEEIQRKTGEAGNGNNYSR